MWTTILITAIVTWMVVTALHLFTIRQKSIEHAIEHLYTAGEPQFCRSIGGLLSPSLLAGNLVTPLINGDQIFPSMLDAIRCAKRTICFETYIYWSGEIGSEVAEASIERARCGVKVHILLDWVGSLKMDSDLLKRLEEAGAEVQKYHPLRWFNFLRINNRSHRKLLIVDGKIGYTGGVGIADKWLGDAQDPDHWRDSHFRIEGPAVAQMQGVFMDHWLKVRPRVLDGEDYFPPLQQCGSAFAQVFKSSAQEGSESARLMYLLSISAATRSVRLANSYFVPDDLAVETFLRAVGRGVEVEIIVPGKCIDIHVVRRASRALWGKLLEAGVRIYEYQPTMYHCKVLIVDDCWVSVGSTNFENRSFRLNDEANLNVLDADLARNQIEWFERDKAKSKEITFDAWKRRPLRSKIKERVASLLRSQL